MRCPFHVFVLQLTRESWEKSAHFLLEGPPFYTVIDGSLFCFLMHIHVCSTAAKKKKKHNAQLLVVEFGLGEPNGHGIVIVGIGSIFAASLASHTHFRMLQCVWLARLICCIV